MAVPLFNKDFTYLLFFLLPFIVFILAIWRYIILKKDKESNYSTIFLLLQFLIDFAIHYNCMQKLG